jgi:uncharacterized protein YecT (DUF1311 family)
MRFPSLRLVSLVCIAAALFAQAPRQTAENASGCENTVTIAAMRTCEASRYAAAQRELNAAYQGLMDRIDSGQKVKLRTTQRAWLRFRDANSDFQASLVQGGTLAPLIRISSLTEMTEARTEELRKQADP